MHVYASSLSARLNSVFRCAFSNPLVLFYLPHSQAVLVFVIFSFLSLSLQVCGVVVEVVDGILLWHLRKKDKVISYSTGIGNSSFECRDEQGYSKLSSASLPVFYIFLHDVGASLGVEDVFLGGRVDRATYSYLG